MNKKVLAAAVGAASILTFGFFNFFPAFSAEKDMTVNIDKKVGEALFEFEFDALQDYQIEIVRPDGETYSANYSDDHVSVAIQNPPVGEYSVHISADDEIAVSAKLQLRANPSVTINNSEITVSSSIVNLLLYFKDGNLEGKWDDTGIGNVNVVITNPANMQRIVSETVSGTSFSYSIPDNVDEVEVYLVSTSSAKVEGAGTKYTIPVVRSVPGKIIFPDLTITNQESISVTADLQDNLTVVAYDNNNEVYNEALQAGVHDIVVPLMANNNSICVYLIDASGNIITSEKQIDKDMTAPTFNLREEYDGMTTYENTVEIKGSVAGADFLTVDGINVTVEENGKFVCPVTLYDEGINYIELKAGDVAGNETYLTLSINKEIKKNNGLVKILILIVPIILIFSLMGALLYKLKKRATPTENKKVSKPHRTRKKKEKKVKKSDTQETFHTEEGKRILKKRNKIAWVTYWVYIAITVVLLGLFMRFATANTIVASGSMEPTLMTGDVVIYNRLAYVLNNVQRGDIILFHSDEYGMDMGKRIVGIAGDVIEFHDGYVFINGMLCDESAYLDSEIETNSGKSFEVPEGCVFVMGDNRENSKDSRFFENPYISEKSIIGKYLGTIPNPFK